jgi:hypothetical protein
VNGPVAFVGSGEYLPVMAAVEAELLRGRPPRDVQIPTAPSLEGDASLDRWVALGREQAARLGVEAVPVVVRDRADADDPAFAARVEGAGLVYLSGGNPPHCAATLRGTRVWDAVNRILLRTPPGTAKHAAGHRRARRRRGDRRALGRRALDRPRQALGVAAQRRGPRRARRRAGRRPPRADAVTG